MHLYLININVCVQDRSEAKNVKTTESRSTQIYNIEIWANDRADVYGADQTYTFPFKVTLWDCCVVLNDA